jgi:lipopolysaccharide export LptBFGC system permease protein LptF
MKIRLLEVLICIVLGFFSGLFLSGTGRHIEEGGIEILLGCIFWISVFSYIRNK